MASSGIPGVTIDAVSYIQKALVLDLTDVEASASFSRLIEESLNDWFTRVNFLFHNVAQNLQYSAPKETSSGELLSFIPKSFS